MAKTEGIWQVALILTMLLAIAYTKLRKTDDTIKRTLHTSMPSSTTKVSSTKVTNDAVVANKINSLSTPRLSSQNTQYLKYPQPMHELGRRNFIKSTSVLTSRGQLKNQEQNQLDSKSIKPIATKGMCTNLLPLLNSPFKRAIPAIVNLKFSQMGGLNVEREVGRTRITITSATPPKLISMQFIDAVLCAPNLYITATIVVEISAVKVHVENSQHRNSKSLLNTIKTKNQVAGKFCCGSTGCGPCDAKNKLGIKSADGEQLGTVAINGILKGHFSFTSFALRSHSLSISDLYFSTDHPSFTYLAGVFEPLIEEIVNSHLKTLSHHYLQE